MRESNQDYGRQMVISTRAGIRRNMVAFPLRPNGTPSRAVRAKAVLALRWWIAGSKKRGRIKP